MSQALTAFQSFGPEKFSALTCQMAPYFSTINPLVVELRPGYAEATAPFRREITNHLGSVHAIALCNLAELTAGLMTDASIPPGARWIPKGMTVEYLAKAKSAVRATAVGSDIDWSSAGDKIVEVEVLDEQQQRVFTARISMNVKL